MTDRSAAATAAFAAVFGRLNAVRPKGWAGASQRIRERAPHRWRAIREAEAQVDAEALSWVRGETHEYGFQRALREYERVWREAAALLDDQDGKSV